MQVLSATIVPVTVSWFMISALFVMIGFMFRGSVYPSSAATFSLVFFTVAPAYFALVSGIAVVKRIKQSFARLRKIPGASLFRCRFSDTTFNYENEAGMTCSIPYSILFRLTPEPTGILVTVDQGRFLFVPRESFLSQADFERASQWCLRAQLAKNPAKGQVMN